MESAEVLDKALELMAFSEATTRTKATGENDSFLVQGVARGIKDFFVTKAKIELEKVK